MVFRKREISRHYSFFRYCFLFSPLSFPSETLITLMLGCLMSHSSLLICSFTSFQYFALCISFWRVFIAFTFTDLFFCTILSAVNPIQHSFHLYKFDLVFFIFYFPIMLLLFLCLLEQMGNTLYILRL